MTEPLPSHSVLTEMGLPQNCLQMMTETDSTQCSQVEAALQESEAFNHAVFESSADCIKVLDLDGCLLSINRPGVCLMELEDCTPLIGTAWAEFWQDSDRAAASQAVQTAKAGGNSRFSGYCPTAKSTPKWWDVVVTPILDVSGQPKQLLVISRDISDRKRIEAERNQVEAALQASEARLRFMLDATQIGEWDLDLTTQPYTAHRSLRHDQIFGYESLLSDWNYEVFLTHVHPDDRATVNEKFQQTLSAHTAWNFECRIIHLDQSVHWIWVRSSVYCNHDGTPTRLLGMVEDITDRKQAEIALQNSEEQFRNLADHAPFMVWVTDPSGYCTYLSQSWYDLTGQTPETGLGFGWLDRTHPDDRADAERMFLEANEQHQSFRLEYRLQNKHGDYIWAIDAASPWFGVDGEFKGYIGSVIDITDRKQAEAALEQRETELRLVTNAVPALIAFVDSDQRYRFNNRGYEEWFGRPAMEIYGKPVREVLGETAYEGIRPYVEQVLAGQQVTFENQVPYKEGGTRHVSATYVPRFDAQGAVEGFVALVNDISERKQAEATLRQSEERFQAFMNHSPAAAWITDRDGRILYLSQTYFRIFQFSPEDIIGKTIFDIYPGDIAQQFLNNIQQAADTREVVETMEIAPRSNGTLGDFLVYKFPIADKSGEVLVGGVAIDITDRKQAEAALQESEERYRTLFESIDEGFCVVEVLLDAHSTPIDYRVLEVNPTFVEQTGLQQAIGKTARQLNLEENWIEIYGRVALTGESIRFENGSEALNRWFDVYACRTGEPEARKVAIVFKDISEAKQAEKISRRTAELDAFRVSLTDALRSLADPVEIQATASRVLGEHLGANRVAYFEVCGTNYVVERDYVNGAAALAGSYPIDSFGPKLLAAYRDGCTVSVSDVESDPNLSPSQRSAYTAIQIGAYIGIPLVKDSEFVAGLAVHIAEPRVWKPEEVALAEEVAERTWAAVERASAEAVITADLQGMQLLHKLGAQLVTEGDIQTLYQGIISAAIALTRADAGTVQILDEATQELVLLTTQGFEQNMTEHFYRMTARSETSCGIALKNGDRTFIDFDVPESEDPTGSLRMHVDAGYFSAQSTPLITRFGKPLGIVSTYWRNHHRPSDRELRFLDLLARQAADLIKQRQTEAALRDSENRLRMAIEAAQLGTWDWDLTTNHLIWDQGCKAMFGLPPETESSIEVFFAGLHSDDRDRLEQVVQWTLNPASGGKYDAEYRTIGIQDGIEQWIAARGQVYFDAADNPQRFVGTVLNITEQKRIEVEREQLFAREQAARAEADRANRIKDEFLAVLSHELRSPLNPILGWTKLLRGGKLNFVKTAEALATIERNAKLQSQLIEDLLDISRIMQGKLVLNAAPVSLAFVISSAIETVRLAAEAKNIGIEVHLESNIGQVSGDAGRLQQVVWNLLSNAVKFSPTGGRVEICLTQVSHHVRLQVLDTGKGIVPEFLPYVFEHFRQEDGATTRKFGGLGLGLAIARQIVTLHGGRIWVESLGEDQGATFTVELPCLQIVNPIKEVTNPILVQSDTLPLANLRVLIVDDEPDSREFVVFVVEQAGAEVTAVSSAIEALQRLSATPFDFLLSDIGMPEMDGYELMRQLSQTASELGGQIPMLAQPVSLPVEASLLPKAIALTAYAGEINQQQALAAGFQGHLTKPVEPDELIEAIVAVMNRNEIEVEPR